MDIRQLMLPSGVGLTHVKVYDAPGADGSAAGGGAHIHTVCSEVYYTLAGTGAIELLSFEGLKTVDLLPGKVVCFRPGVAHRLLNPHANLEILAIMQNGGLPERGDFVMTFPTETLASPAAYSQAVRVSGDQDALRRRDLSITGFEVLKQAMVRDREKGRELLRQFYRMARNLIAPKVDGFEWVLKSGAQAEAKFSLDAVDFLRLGRTDYLEHATHNELFPFNAPGTNGMVGTLHAYALGDTTHTAEGKKVA